MQQESSGFRRLFDEFIQKLHVFCAICSPCHRSVTRCHLSVTALHRIVNGSASFCYCIPGFIWYNKDSNRPITTHSWGMRLPAFSRLWRRERRCPGTNDHSHEPNPALTGRNHKKAVVLFCAQGGCFVLFPLLFWGWFRGRRRRKGLCRRFGWFLRLRFLESVLQIGVQQGQHRDPQDHAQNAAQSAAQHHCQQHSNGYQDLLLPGQAALSLFIWGFLIFLFFLQPASTRVLFIFMSIQCLSILSARHGPPPWPDGRDFPFPSFPECSCPGPAKGPCPNLHSILFAVCLPPENPGRARYSPPDR